MTTKTYTIKLDCDPVYQRLMAGIDGWRIDPKTYTTNREALTIITKNPNVVDVCTEEIYRERYELTVEKTPAKARKEATA